MVDIHSHILPGLDDGSLSLEMSLEMARMAVRDGIHTIIATPHYNNGRYDNEYEDILFECNQLNAELENVGIPLKVLPGQEVHVTYNLIEQIVDKKVGTLYGTRYILLELPHNSIPIYLKELLLDLDNRNLIPIIAHPERNAVLIHEPQRLNEIADAGALMQLTAKSITGGNGKSPQRLAMQMIKSHCAHFIASDAHNSTTRSVNLSEAYKVVSRVIGRGISYSFRNHAIQLLQNEPISRFKTKLVKKQWFGL